LKAVQEARSERERLAATPADDGARRRRASGGPTVARLRTAANAKLRAAIASARTTIKDEMNVFKQLTVFLNTSERESLRGSAMKRLAMLEAGAGRPEAARHAVEAMAAHYQSALEIGRERDAPDVFYPAINLIAAQLVLHAGTAKWKGLPPELFEEARRSVRGKNQSRPDFWSLVAEPELRLYEAVARNTLPKDLPAIERSFRDVFKRSQGGTQWSSVSDTTRFVLDPYIARGQPAAKKSARAVLELIEHLAKPKPVSQ
jgi:hypothetical protein